MVTTQQQSSVIGAVDYQHMYDDMGREETEEGRVSELSFVVLFDLSFSISGRYDLVPLLF